MRIYSGIILFAGVLLVFGCSDPQQTGQFDSVTGKHGGGWLPLGHAQAVPAGITAAPSNFWCAECHGADLSGGISKVSCSSCHLGGPFSVHPASWSIVVLDHGPTATQLGTSVCANVNCHGATLTGVSSSGPSCTTCHSIPFDPATVVCGSCHAIPPSGTILPNKAGRHGQHVAHGSSTLSTCSWCHQGTDGAAAAAGGSIIHFNRVVEVSIDVIYTAKSGGAATFNPSTDTCSNISCHGGQTTPDWLTGTLNVSSQCTSCHAYGTTQYNSFNSGQHNRHVNGQGIGCTTCHDPAKLTVNHFTTLNTSTMEGPAWQTIYDAIQYNGTTCAKPCHDPENWR